MNALAKIFENFLSFKRIPLKIVLITALASYVLQLGMIIMGQPLYIIVFYTLLPWIPVLLFEGLWKVEHYQWIAVFAIITALQVGHLGEHFTQVAQLVFDGTLACPPPVDAGLNYDRAIEAGLRDPSSPPTNYATSLVVLPDAEGLPTYNDNGEYRRGPAACGVFGQLDIEIVHLVWELFGWFATLILLRQFPKNIWLWLAVVFLSIHAIEHLFISYAFFIDTNAVYAGTRQLWATVADGSIVTAIPIGIEPALVPFYDVAGKFGIVARNGLIGTFLPDLNPLLPTRPWLHFGYNTLITVPTVIGFVLEMRRIYDRYLAQALPSLSKEQLVSATPQLERMTFNKGEVIIKQGDIADRFYIISKGEVEVIGENKDGSSQQIATLGQGKFFGEIGLLSESKRIATVCALSNDVEVMALNREVFRNLMESSEMSKQDVNRVMRQRVAETSGEPAS
ncbi:MAG: cyclic nucleotide-binding domain-containing protein [Anaerolineae bacterium]